ncbi:serine/threonine protein kinase [Phormidium sp. CLA17]|uniref:serine/threonine-protein kinase n=1 Tax=Leptolyngbya sp. Cla-17 TaxID=2803751 RepID=UPI001492D8DB|nr:serine/threonine-protein kinase [Leptolyngbya sp. Cla-17]MBM0742720.1 serine/threonine protein kinase [Leptolyngbya sp. Cla-17]
MSNVISPAVVHYPELNGPLNGRYQVNEILAARLWERTYLAQDLHHSSQSECIIHHFKQIAEIPNYAESVRSLFAKEVERLEEFGTHEQIPQVLAYFEDDEGFYVVQEFVEGRSLSQELIPNLPWSSGQVVTLLREVLEPLAFVHHRDGLHGNIKPDNLLRGQAGRLVLIDFGSMAQIQQECMAAYAVEGDPTQLSEQSYQPMEQLQGLPCAASDVYAIGMIAIQALTGRHPTQFKVDPQSGKVLWLPYYKEAISPINRGLVGVINRMVQSDLSQRFGSAREALQALQTVGGVTQNQARLPMESRPAVAPITMTVPATSTNAKTEVAETEIAGIEIAGTDSESVANPVPHQPVFLTRLLMSAIASPSVHIGVGGTLLTAIAAAIGWSLLNSVNWSQPNQILGKVSKKLQKSQPPVQAGLAKPERMQTVSDAWLQDWTQATNTFQQAEQAVDKGNWLEARQLTQSMSTKIPYWKDRNNALAKQVIAKAEVDSKNLLQTAYDRARDRDFVAALSTLKQIVPETTAGAIAQTKVDEYRMKRAVKAQADLQKAYDRAILRDFTQALTYLGQVSQDTPAYEIAQRKVVEYSRKAQVRARLMLKAAADYAEQQNFLAALTTLEKIPSDSLIDGVIEQKLTEYTVQLNQQAAEWLQQANAEAATGRKATAIAFLQKVPIGTPAYAQAREQLAEIAQTSAVDQHNLNPIVSAMSVSDLNPGTYLREATATLIRQNKNG